MSFYTGIFHSWFSLECAMLWFCQSVWCSVLLLSLCVISLWLQERLLEIRKSCLAYRSFRSFLLGDWPAALSLWGDRYVSWGIWEVTLQRGGLIDSRAHHCNPNLLVSTSQNFEVPPDSTDTWADPNCSRIICLVGYLWGTSPLSFLPPWVLVL